MEIAEFEKLALANAHCVMDAGYSIDPAHLRLNGLGLMSYTVDLGETTPDGFRETVSECAKEYLSEVEKVWVLRLAPVYESVATEFREWTARCITEAGHPAEELPWESDDPAISRATGECTREAMSVFDTGNLGFGFAGDGRDR